MKRILVVAPHPDDEAIGCGGTLCHHLAQGDKVRVIFLTSGEKGGHGRSEAETIRIREREARAAAKILGIRQFEFWHEPDGAVAPAAKSVSRMRRVLEDFRPDIVYITHDREMHPDHRGAVRILRQALKRKGGAKPDVRMYEVWTPIQTLDEIVDVSRYMTKKVAAVRAYGSQCAVVDFVAAIRGLNRYRGEFHSWPGGNYAEVFTRLKP